MGFKMRSEKFVIYGVALTVLFVGWGSAGAVTLWEEDFEGYAAGTPIQDATGWETSAADGPILINGFAEDSSGGHRLEGSGMALDGNSNLELGAPGRVWSTSRATVPGPTTNSELIDYTVSFDTIVQRGGNANGTGNSGLYINYGESSEFGLHFMRANGKGWGFVNSGPGLSNVSEYEGFVDHVYFGANVPTTASITLDKTTMMASATVAGHDFTPQPFTQAVWDGIIGLEIRNDIDHHVNPNDDNFGMDVDNILVTGNTATDFSWKGGSGDWNQAANWAPGGTPGNGAAGLSNETVLFGAASSATSTIFTDSQVDINHIQFDNETASHFIVGPGGVNMIATTEDTPASPAVNVLAGDHTFQTPFSIGDDTTVTVASGSLAFDGQVDLAGHTLTLSGTTSFNHSVVDSVGGGLVVILSGEVSGLSGVSVVPEPSSLVLVLLAGGLGLVGGRNRKQVKSRTGTTVKTGVTAKKLSQAVTLLVALLLAVPASAVTLYEEDFESYSAGTPIENIPGWFNNADPGVKVNDYAENSVSGHGLLGSGKALDGNSHNEYYPDWTPLRIWAQDGVTVPGPTSNSQATDYSLSFDAMVQYGSNSNGTGNAGVYFDFGVSGTEFGLHYSRSNGQGWGFVATGDGLPGTTERASQPWWYTNVPVKGTITLDKETMTATARIEELQEVPNYAPHDFAPVTFTEDVWNGITALSIRNDVISIGNNRGIDVDNIRITATTPTDFIWNGGSGDWSQSANWAPTGNPGNGMATFGDDTVAFGDTGGVNSTVFTNLPIEVNQLDFDGGTAGYSIAGPGGVSMITTTEDTPVAPAVGVASGDHAFQTPFSIGADTTVTITTGSLAFDNAVDVAGNMLTLVGTTSLNHSVVDTGEGGSVFGSGTLGTEGDTTIGANLSLDGATLAIDVRDNSTGQTSDQFDVVGSTTLNGDITVDVNLPGGYTPSSDVAILTTTGGIVDNSLSLSLAGSAAGSFAGVSVVGNNLMLLVGGSVSVPGDYNGNGSVDAADYTLWQDSNGDTVDPGTGADGVADGTINNLDYLYWKTQFANSGGSGSAAAVPEPSSLALVLLAGFFGMVRIYSRR
jgi:hypothetical protein